MFEVMLPSPARVRFAPSPSGKLHLGNARTTVVNWLFARSRGGAVILRVEDSDPEQRVPDALRSLYQSLRWLGLDWDEGPECGGDAGPHLQSARVRSTPTFSSVWRRDAPT